MFSSISHDMRTPINAMTSALNYIQPVLKKAEKEDIATEVDSALVNKQQSPAMFFFDVCTTSLAFLLTLVNDTLDYS